MKMHTNYKIIFLHIPKAAGTTFKSILKRKYKKRQIINFTGKSDEKINYRDFLSLSTEEKDNYFAITGHMPFGVHKHINSDFKYITFLRDPVKRVISLFYFIKRNKNHKLHSILNEKNYSLEEFLDSHISIEVDNHQTRLLSGDVNLPFGQCSVEQLNKAKKNIKDYFTLAGISERFDESLLLIAKDLNWRKVYYANKNQSVGAKVRTKLSDDVIEKIKYYNAFDIELYKYALELLDTKLEQNMQYIQKNLPVFKKRNAVYSKYFEAYFKFRKIGKRILK